MALFSNQSPNTSRLAALKQAKTPTLDRRIDHFLFHSLRQRHPEMAISPAS